MISRRDLLAKVFPALFAVPVVAALPPLPQSPFTGEVIDFDPDKCFLDGASPHFEWTEPSFTFPADKTGWYVVSADVEDGISVLHSANGKDWELYLEEQLQVKDRPIWIATSDQ